MITNLSNENADLQDVMNSNQKFDVSLEETLLWHSMNLMPLFRRLKGRKYQLPVVIFYVRPLVSVNSCCINLNHTGPDSIQVTITSYNIYQTLKLLISHVVLTLVSLDQMVYKSQSSVTIFIKLKNC